MSGGVANVRIHPDGVLVERRVVAESAAGTDVLVSGLSEHLTDFEVIEGSGGVEKVELLLKHSDASTEGTSVVVDALLQCEALLGEASAKCQQAVLLRNERKAIEKALISQAEAVPHGGAAAYKSHYTTDLFQSFVVPMETRLETVRERETELRFSVATLLADWAVFQDTLRRIWHGRFAAACDNSAENWAALDLCDALTTSEKRLNRILEELANLQVKKSTAFKLRPKAAADTDLEVRVRYRVPQASWEPTYTFYCSGENVVLEYYAEISNWTGEDWNAVNLSLERGRLNQTKAPKCHGRTVGFPQPTPSVLCAAPGGRSRMMKRCLAAAESAPADNAIIRGFAESCSVAPPEDAGIAASFVLADPVSLLSSPQKQRVLITRKELKNSQIVHWVVLEGVQSGSFAASRVLRAVNDTGFELLPGRAEVYVDGSYIGKQDVKAVRVNQPFTLGLSPDDQVVVTHQKFKQHTAAASLFNATGVSQRVFTLKYEVRSFAQVPTVLYLAGHLPLSSDAAAKVALHKPALSNPDVAADLDVALTDFFTADGAMRNSATNTVVQRVTVHPTEVTTASGGQANAVVQGTWEYSVTVPAGKDLKIVLLS